MASPVARLIALTDEAVYALGGIPEVPISAFPVRVGRERRSTQPGAPTAEDLRGGHALPLNDLFLTELPDAGSHHISNTHFEIIHTGGCFFLVDRCSSCGTIVAGTRIGGHRAGGTAELHHGDQIVVGTTRSRYIFRFAVDASDQE